MRPRAALLPAVLLTAPFGWAVTPVAVAQDAGTTTDQPAATQPEAPPEPTPPAIADLDANRLAEIVRSLETPMTRRRDAARRLVELGGARDALVAINAVLGSGDSDDSGARLILRAMGRAPVVASELWAPVALIPVQDDPELRALVASAAGSFRIRAAAEHLIGWLADADPGVARAAHSALVRLSGRDYPPEADAWREWLARQGTLDGVAWMTGLVEGLSARADDQQRRAESAEALLAEAYRRLHLALPPADRPALLAEMLHQPISRVRSLAFDLIDRELASSTTLGPEVGQAAVALLGDQDVAVRRRAAAMVVRLAPESAPQAIVARLSIERDPAVATALLRGVARWPSELAVTPVTRWSERTGPVGDAALEAAWAMARAGALGDEPARDRLLEILRGRSPDSLSPAALRLRLHLGAENDLESVRTLLASSEAPARMRAAEVLAPDPGSLDAIITSAQADPGLFDVARRAIATHRPTARGLELLRSLATPSPEAGAEAEAQLLGVLPIDQLLIVAPTLATDIDRERALSRIEAQAPAPPAQAPGTLALGLLTLAEARLMLSRPGDALSTLDRADLTAAPNEARAREREARAACLLALGRIDEAASIDCSPDAWLRGLELSIPSDHARGVHDELTARFAGALSPEQSERLKRLRDLLEKTPDAETPTPQEPDSESP